MKLQTNVMSYGGNGKVDSVPERPRGAARERAVAKKDCGCNGAGTCAAEPSANGHPDFSKMTSAQKLAYHRARWDRVFGPTGYGV